MSDALTDEMSKKWNLMRTNRDDVAAISQQTGEVYMDVPLPIAMVASYECVAMIFPDENGKPMILVPTAWLAEQCPEHTESIRKMVDFVRARVLPDHASEQKGGTP